MDSTLQQKISPPAGTRCFMIDIKSIKKDEDVRNTSMNENATMIAKFNLANK